MKIVVTGGAGFIGSHIVDAYIAKGHRVVVIDNFSTGTRKNLNKKATLYKADICNKKRIDAIFKKERPEIVNHHAALIETVKSLASSAATFEVNTLGAVNVLLAFGAHGKGKRRKCIFSSSAGVYGSHKKLPLTETAPAEPTSPYGTSKLLAEEAIRFYGRAFGFPHLIFRYANVYGPRQREVAVIPKFIALMQRGTRPTIYGNEITRDYIHVSDIARANMLGLRRGADKTLNISTGKETATKAVFETLARELNFTKKPRYALQRAGEIKRSVLSPRRAHRVLGWKPRIPLEKGIRRTLDSSHKSACGSVPYGTSRIFRIAR